MRRSKHGPALFELIGKDDFRSRGAPSPNGGVHGPSPVPKAKGSLGEPGVPQPAGTASAANVEAPLLAAQDRSRYSRPQRRGGLDASSWQPTTVDVGWAAVAEDEQSDVAGRADYGAAPERSGGARYKGAAMAGFGRTAVASSDQLVDGAGRLSRFWSRATRKTARPERQAERSDDDSCGPRLIEFVEDRVRISLTSVAAAVLACGLILSLAGGFLLGQSRGRQAGLTAGYQAARLAEADPANGIEVAKNQPPATYLIGGLLEAAPPEGRDADAAPSSTGFTVQTPPSRSGLGKDATVAGDTASRRNAGQTSAGGPVELGTIGWVEGFTYVVVQEFPSGGRNDALAAQTYLAEHGVETEVVALASGRCQLMTTQGFDRKDQTQRKRSDQFLEKIRAIGAQYYAAGGRYKLEGYLKTYKGQ